jgi:hypothetical protein
MKTFNSISGGKTSAYLEANYPSDYRAFALVRTGDKRCLFPDAKLRQMVSDRIGLEFIGTLEDNVIINTIFDLEQFTGREIKWVTGKTFDETIDRSTGVPRLPSALNRFCTSEMKVKPIFDYWRSLDIEPWEVRFGFRANEMRRANNVNSRLNENGILTFKAVVGKTKNGLKNRWGEIEYQKPHYPLIQDGIFKDKIEEFWKDKPVRFAWMNNCVGCMHKEPILLKKMMMLHPEKLQWFTDKEKQAMQYPKNTWRQDVTYEQIQHWNPQYELFDDDFNECDSGYCGI